MTSPDKIKKDDCKLCKCGHPKSMHNAYGCFFEVHQVFHKFCSCNRGKNKI
jgi:hypothetical protein